MKIIISPAKNMKPAQSETIPRSLPAYLSHTQEIIEVLRTYSPMDLEILMRINPSLALDGADRIQTMKFDQNGTAAIETYDGIQYKYMAPAVFEEQAFTWLEKHLRILSGFYGALSPFDGVIPYRLEMQARFHKEEIDNLYDFWGQKLADYVLKDCDCLINLASKEYSKSILKYIPENVRVITCVFGELIDGKIKEKGTYAKMARGSLVRYMAEHQIENPEEIKQFDELGYKYKEEYSNSTKYCYLIH